MDTSPKTVREHIARTKFNLQRRDILKALKSLAHALDLLVAGQIVGRERIEIGILLDEAVRLLMEQDMIKRSLPGGLSYVKGKERELSATLNRMAQALEEVLGRMRAEERRKNLLELDELILAAQAELDKKEPLEARRLFRKAMENFAEEPGLMADIGNRLVLAGLPAEAMEYLQKSLELAPTDMRAYTLLAQCHEFLGDADKAEDMLRTILRRFGPNEAILLRLGKAALGRRNWDEALNCALAVLKLSPQNAEAVKIAREASERVYGTAEGYLKPDLKRGAAPGGKVIEVDF
jgi:tetratricopeptide (TPR) repeat protein